MRWLLAVCLVLLPLFARADDEGVTHFTLDNGLQVVVIADHRAPIVTHMVWYRVGAADEGPGESGLAHFFEHLMFKGTETVAPGEFSTIVAAQGGNDNAFTSADYTAYFQRVAVDRLDLVMGLEADRMVNLRLAESDVVTERNVVLEERRTRTDSDPGAQFSEQVAAATWLNHPYRRPIIGWQHEIAALNRAAALDFYRRHYGPDNAIVIVAGDVTPDQVRALADKHYGPLPAHGAIAPRARPAEPPQLAARRVVMADARVGQPYLLRHYLAPARQSGQQDEAAALSVLAQLLGAGPNSVLARAMQFDQSLAVQTDAYYDATGLDGSRLTLVVVPAPGVTLAAAEAALDDALAGFLASGVDAGAFASVMVRLRAQEIYARDSAFGMARRYGVALTTGLTVADEQEWPAVLQRVTPDDVMAVAQQVLDARRSTTGWLRKEATQ